MPRSTSLYGRQRASAAFDQYVYASINEANGKHDPENGGYAPLVINGIATREEADLIENGLFNSAYWHHKRGVMPVSMSAKTKQNLDGSYRVEFRVYNKDHARAYVDRTYGPDPENRPYSPFRFHRNYNA